MDNNLDGDPITPLRNTINTPTTDTLAGHPFNLQHLNTMFNTDPIVHNSRGSLYEDNNNDISIIERALDRGTPFINSGLQTDSAGTPSRFPEVEYKDIVIDNTEDISIVEFPLVKVKDVAGVLEKTTPSAPSTGSASLPSPSNTTPPNFPNAPYNVVNNFEKDESMNYQRRFVPALPNTDLDVPYHQDYRYDSNGFVVQNLLNEQPHEGTSQTSSQSPDDGLYYSNIKFPEPPVDNTAKNTFLSCSKLFSFLENLTIKLVSTIGTKSFVYLSAFITFLCLLFVGLKIKKNTESINTKLSSTSFKTLFFCSFFNINNLAWAITAKKDTMLQKVYSEHSFILLFSLVVNLIFIVLSIYWICKELYKNQQKHRFLLCLLFFFAFLLVLFLMYSKLFIHRTN